MHFRNARPYFALVLLLAGPALPTCGQISKDVKTTVLSAQEVQNRFLEWVDEITVLGERTVRLTGDRDQVLKAMGAVALADEGAQAQQDDADRGRSNVTRLLKVRHASPEALERLLRFFGPVVYWDPTLQVLAMSGRQSDVNAAADALAELDAPEVMTAERDVVFDVHLVGGHFDEQDVRSLPPAVRGAVDTIRETFPFETYGLLESLTLRTTAGGDKASVTGHIQTEGLPTRYRFEVEIGDGHLIPERIRLRRLHLEFRSSHENTGFDESAISTKLTTSDGKTVVVGKAGIRGVADAVFLILTTRLG